MAYIGNHFLAAPVNQSSDDLSGITALRRRTWQAGYRPLMVYTWNANHKDAGKAPVGDKWTERARQAVPEAARFDAVRHGQNTGILCDGLRAIDVDIDDADMARLVRDAALDRFGETIIRTRNNSGRCLLVYRAALGSPTKVVLAGAEGKVEVLGHGQQFVAFGRHPTGADLEWVAGRPDTWPRDDLPAISEDAVAEFLTAVAPVFGADPASVRVAGAATEAAGLPTTSALGLTADCKLDVAAALAVIPNNGPADWEHFNKIGMATYAATAGDTSGFAAFCAWSAQHPAHDPAECSERWSHYPDSPPGAIGAGTLFHLAREAWPDWRKPSEVAAAASAAPMAPAPVVSREPPAIVMDGLDGVLRSLTEFSVRTAPSPQPFLSLAAAICAVGAAAGRRYQAPTGLRTNVMAIGLAGSGGGKDYPRKCVRRAFNAAGLAAYLGGSKIASGSGLLTALQSHPVKLFLIDEFGHMIAQNSGRNAGAWKAEILSLTTELFTTADSTYGGTEYGDRANNPIKTIEQPCLVLFGVTVPGTLWRALSSGSMGDGSLARFLIFQTAEDYPDLNRGVRDVPMPSEIADAFAEIAGGVVGHSYGEGNLTSLMAANVSMTPYVVPYGAGAEAMWEGIRDKQVRWSRQHRETPAEPFVGRFAEHTLRLATIKAISRDPQAPVITTDDVAWAEALAHHCIVTVLREAAEKMADNQTESNVKAVLAFIQRNGSVPLSAIARKFRTIGARDRHDILADLVATEMVSESVVSGRGKTPATVYTAVEAAETWDLRE